MGKACKWFKSLLGIKRSTDANQNHVSNPSPNNKWGFTKSHREKDRDKSHHDGIHGGDNDDGAGNHAIAVAAATAAVAEATLAAAQAARAVIQLTSSGRNMSVLSSVGDVIAKRPLNNRSGGCFRGREAAAAVTIQAHFRSYLSRRALRALKALVKLQALVRKQTVYALQRLQALVRVQVRAQAGRVLVFESPHSSRKSSHFSYPGPATPEKFEHITRGRSMKHEQLTMLERNSSESSGSAYFDPEKSHSNRTWMESRMGERLGEQGPPLPMDDRNDKILEVDPGKLHGPSKCMGLVYSSNLRYGSDQNCRSFSTSKVSAVHQSVPSTSYGEFQSSSPMNFAQDFDETANCTVNNSPAFQSASSRGGSSKRGAFIPAKSDATRSCLSGYSDHPNYMANTQSSRAKLRSVSAPKHRPHFDRSGSTKRDSIHAYGNSRCVHKVPSLHANKAYPGSGPLDRLGMPIRGDVAGFSGGRWHRF